MAIETSQLANPFTSTTDFRLRLVTLLSLYDLLPHSISRPPNAEEPVELNDALSPALVQYCFDILQKHELYASFDEHSSAEVHQASSSHPDSSKTAAYLQELAAINAHTPLWRTFEGGVGIAHEINKPTEKRRP